MTRNPYLQALIIAVASTVANTIPYVGGCFACIIVIGLFLYFSKLQAKENPDYGIGAGIQFGMIYAAIGTVFTLIVYSIFGSFFQQMILAELEKNDQAGMDQVIDLITGLSHGELVMWATGIALVFSVFVGLLLGLVSGLIFKDDDE